PAIPLRPTATAANRDMGIIVHVLGSARAIPVNYRHVVINEGAIDWVSGGRNYTDVVSQAADEAGGRAFVTDFAGRHAGGVSPLPAEAIAALGEAPTWEDVLRSGLVVDADVARVLAASITETAPGLDPAQAVACPRCYGDDEVTLDGAAFVHRLREEVEAPRLAIARLFETHPYLTRLYTTMSPDEMAEDPVFDENPDLEDAWNLHLATRYITCDESGPRFDEAVIETASGLRFALRDGQNPDAIRRQNGETVRGAGVPAAAVIEQTLVAGQSRILTDRRRVLAARYGASGGGEGCGCTAGGGRPATLGLLLLGLVGLRRRR
ncbi:MAG: DUF2330 domain-containing protein, partial [Myxococcales bacterium]|nr:DUF2330 domain-containing protein [Myxococcales bacterium]